MEFLVKIREVMSIAKEKMTSKRFIPILSDIPEEDLYHSVDLGWDIPCARRGRRFSAISLKRENSRRAVHCGGCPGCDSSSSKEQKVTPLTRSNSCKTCVSEDYKQRVVRKWLEEVPTPPRITRPVKSVAKVSGTPRIIEMKQSEEMIQIQVNSSEPLENKETEKLNITEAVIKNINTESKQESLNTKEIITESNSKMQTSTSQNRDREILTKGVSDIPQALSPKIKTNRSPSQHTRRLRKKLPPPPPPPVTPPKPVEEEEIPPEIKVKMEAVIREFSECRKVEPILLEEIKTESVVDINPKIVIPVLAADSQYYSDDNMLSDPRKRVVYLQRENYEMDSLERGMLKKRRFSVACGPEWINNSVNNIDTEISVQLARDRLSRSCRDVRKAISDFDENKLDFGLRLEQHSLPVSEVIVNTISEPLYNNVPKPGPLTIQVRGSPIENRRIVKEEFDPDTLDRKPKRENKNRVDKILLKSGGSFKNKEISSENNAQVSNPTDSMFTRKIGSLRQIYEAKAKAQEEEVRRSFYQRRGSVQSYNNDDRAVLIRSIKTPDLIRQTEKEHKPPIPPKQRRGSDVSCKFISTTRENPLSERHSRSPEERDRFPPYMRSENINARRSGRRSTRTRSRRTDLRKLYRTEDSGYLSTDSNESKRRARYLMQLHPRTAIPEVKSIAPTPIPIQRSPLTQMESDTDDLESLCDGRSESGGESVETDSVFYGNFDDSKQLFAELGLRAFEPKAIPNMEQIDSGFVGETNIVLSGDSDSEHRSVISIVADCDGRASSASVKRIDDSPYMQSIEC